MFPKTWSTSWPTELPRNVRELEGALTRTLIYAELHGLPLQPATAEQALSGLGRAAADRPPASDAILAAHGAAL